MSLFTCEIEKSVDDGSAGFIRSPGPGKWYCLNWVDSNDNVHEVPLDELEVIAARLGVTAMGDHCFNPSVVLAWANENCIELVEDGVLDQLIGRWALNHDNWEPKLPDGWNYT